MKRVAEQHVVHLYKMLLDKETKLKKFGAKLQELGVDLTTL